MEVTIDSPSSIKHNIHVVLTPEELQGHFDKAYAKAAKTIDIHGFRKGKAPLAMIKKIYGEEIEYREIDEITNSYYKQIVKEKNIKPVGEPILDDVHYHRGESLKFTITVEVLPEFELQDLKGIAVNKIVHTVTDEELDKELEYLRRVNATMTDVQQATDDEHVVTFEIQELDDSGVPVIGNRTGAMQILLSDETKLSEIREGLKNSEVGKKYLITYTPQQGERIEPIDGEFTVIKIQKVELPPLDEAFAKKVTKDRVSSVKEFTDGIRKDIEAYWADKTTRHLEDAIAGEVVNRHTFEVPETLIKGFTDSMLDEVKEKQPGKTLPVGFDEQKFRTENREYAMWQAKWFLLREKIREQLKLTVEDADFEKLAEVEAPKIGIEKDRLIAYYKNAKSMNEKILNDKMFEYLVTNAKITEKPDTDIEESNLITA